jgi:uncharacterized membrane protein YphA (DoxX/SURF4 family)
MESYRNPQAATPGLILRDLGLLALRIGAACVLGLHHGWQQCLSGWNFLWHKQPWDLHDLLVNQGLPIPQVFAVCVVLCLVLGSMGLLFGVLARMSAGVLMACTIGAISLQLGEPAAEKFWLYGIIYFVLLLCGPGSFSLAFLLKRR